MPLAPGSKLGPYEIVSPLGAGGMGEVYRAKDTRLERTVAIKILPEQLSKDPVRKQRFEREAKTISNLNHPNICTLHDIGSQNGVDYLVMECVEGETLAKRLEKGPLPLEQVLKFGAQIADALDKAHRAGIVHRDLKPGNIMLTATGAKLLDFGLAKPVAPLVSGATLTGARPTTPMTEEGLVVGTFQYMSPEQIEGKDLNGRSDIFSLGAVLYEVLTGTRAFEGKSHLSVASAILEKDPAPISTLKPMTPATLDHAIRQCLAKDPEERWQTARDLALELKWISESGSSVATAAPAIRGIAKRELALAGALGVAVAAAIFFGLSYARRTAPGQIVARAYVKPMPNSSFIYSGTAAGFALSPDGRLLTYVATTPDGKAALWVRATDSTEAQVLPGAEGANYPFWSPDSRFIGFFAGGKLKKIEWTGGPAFVICEASDGRGGTWNQTGDIVFASSVNASLSRVSASGGPVSPVTTLDPRTTTQRWPFFLPDGRHFLYFEGTVFTPRESLRNSIMVGSLDSQESKFLLHSHTNAIYASGQILFMRQSTLMAQPFDTKRMQLTGDAVPVADRVEEGRSVAKGVFSASDTGLLAYVEGTEADRQLIWFDRNGKRVGEVPGMDAYAGVKIAPDGKKVAYYLDSSGYDVWNYELVTGVKTPLTFGTGSGQGNLYPVWSPDSKRIVFTSYRGEKYGLYMKRSDGSGTEELVMASNERIHFSTDWSPDGKTLTYIQGAPGGWAVWMLPLEGERKPYVLHQSGFSEREASFSPDGKWVAYCSNESGEYRVYVVPFPGPGGKWQVSPGGGCGPRWRRDEKEIFYMSLDNKLMASEVNASGSRFTVGATRALFATRAYGVFGRFDVSADGQRFLIPYEAGQPNAAITLVVNWDAKLAKK